MRNGLEVEARVEGRRVSSRRWGMTRGDVERGRGAILLECLGFRSVEGDEKVEFWKGWRSVWQVATCE